MELIKNQSKIGIYRNPFKGFKRTTVLLIVVGFLLLVTAATVSTRNGGICTIGGLGGNSNFGTPTHINDVGYLFILNWHQNALYAFLYL